MRNILIFPVITLAILIIESCQHNPSHTPLKEFPSDSIDVFSPLNPNENWIGGRHTYGADSVIGNTMSYRTATDSDRVLMQIDVTLLELHPRITANLLSFIHGELLNCGFINRGDTTTPFGIKDMSDKGFTQQEILHKALDWESELFYTEVPNLMEWGNGYNISLEIYPVYIDEKYVTYKKESYYYTGGAHGNYSTFLQTFDRTTGMSINTEDLIRPEKIDELREHIVLHMASNYPIYSSVNSVEAYLDSLNRWKGLTNLSSRMGLKKVGELDEITVKNFPINDPGVHEAGLVITYEKYHLTPGCDGCPVILLPFDEIRECLKTPFRNYKTDTSKLVADNESYIECFTEEELDSIRIAWSPADDGGQWPRDIYDWYKYRHGEIENHYQFAQIVGTWVGYGHLYDPRQILTISPDGRFTNITEEAMNQDCNGEMLYNYTNTIKGRYEYDSTKNRITLKNWDFLGYTDDNLEAYVKQANPNNKYMIIHSIVGDTMMVADEIGDLWPYICKSK